MSAYAKSLLRIFGENILQVDPVLNQERFVIAQSFPARCNNSLQVLVHGQFTRKNPNEHEADRRNDEKRQEHQKNSLNHIFCHNFLLGRTASNNRISQTGRDDSPPAVMSEFIGF